jgi:hypothetical protein
MTGWPPVIKAWGDIGGHYGALGASGEGMLRFVEAIRSSPYASTLYAWTSVNDLCIAQVPGSHPYNSPYLRVSPVGDGTIEFRYVDTNFVSKQWHRRVNDDDAFRRLELFLDQLHWVGREAKRDFA